MSVVAGSTEVVPAKVCRGCGARGEWPGQPCLDCKASLNRAVAQDLAGLAEFAASANAEHDQVVGALRSGLAHALAAGRALNEAKAKFPVGESWTDWMRDNLSFCSASANMYMRIDHFRAELTEAEVGSYKDAIRFLQKHQMRVRETLSRDEVDWIHAMVDAGVGQTEIGRELGVGRQTVHHHVAKRRRQPQDPPRVFIADEMVERLALWLVEEFGGESYPVRVTNEVREHAYRALEIALTEPADAQEGLAA